jgi:hypothetical protein
MRATTSLCLLAGLLLPGAGSALEFSSDTLPRAVVDQPYTPPALLVYGAARCPAGDVTFTLDGALPPGLQLTALGQITGVPGKTGIYNFRVRAADSCTATVKPLSIVVAGAPILIVRATTLEFHYRRGGAAPVSQSVLVASTWPDLPYYFDRPDVLWLHAVSRSGRTPRPGAAVEADRVEISVEPGALTPGRYEARLRFWTWQGANAPSVSVRLDVE